MELLRVAHCASKHAKQQAVKFAEFKSLTEKTVLATRFDEVMKNKRPIQTPMQQINPVQQVVHAASNKKQKMMSDTEHFVKAMSKYNVSGSARDKMDSIASFSARKPMENRSYF
jgi:crotonobetainyl-CoA:carnitine CoA-transferase CaiB-like acyl-CoA transferase